MKVNLEKCFRDAGMGVIVFTMRFCPYCVRAKDLLTRRGVSFQEVLVEEDDDSAWVDLERRSGMKTMPQIFFGGELIGGYSELAKIDAVDRLTKLKPQPA